MNFLQFLASIIDSLAWPGVTGFGLYVLRKPAGKLLERVSRFKYKDLEAEFRDTLEDIKPPITDAIDVEVIEKSTVNTVSLTELAEVSPRAAIMEAWIKVENATADYCTSKGLDSRISYQGLRRLPQEQKKEIEHILTPYQELRVLRNKAAHASDFELKPESAKEYIDVANYIIQQLKNITN